MAIWQEPTWLQNYVAEQKANASSFGERYLKPLEQAAISGISAYKSGEKSDKIKSIIDTETNAATTEGRPINYDKIYKLLIPIDKDEAAKYKDLADEYNKAEINKTVAAAFKKPAEEYEKTKEAIKTWDSTATTLKGLQAELETAQSELTNLESDLEKAIEKENIENSALSSRSSALMQGYKPNVIETRDSRYSGLPLQDYIAE